jgi:hypothetical protein
METPLLETIVLARMDGGGETAIRPKKKISLG